MGIDAKEFQAFMWRVLKLSMSSCSAFVQKYPLASGFSLTLLALYLFFPSVFYFLIYSLPFLGCTLVFIRYYLNSQKHGVVERKEHGISSDAADAANRDDNSSIEARRMLQRNVNENKDKSDTHAVKEEKNMVSSMPSNDDFIGRTALVEQKPKVIMEEKASYALNSGGSSSYNVSLGENISEFSEASNPETVSFDGFNEQPAKLLVGGEVESESSSSEVDDEEEESEKGCKNAVEWTANDQKNLMDLGDSELERNRRLESLIARRRARKSFKMSSSAAPGTMHPVLVARSNTFHVSKSSDDRIPSSAPSILLPTQNPFDLPYEPFEEKPNLMADSFQQEFMADHLKEMLFCRHESFSLGYSPPLENTQLDQHEGTGYSRSKMQLDKENHGVLADHSLFQRGETLRRDLTVTDLVTEEARSSNQVTNKRERDREVETSRVKHKGENMGQSHDKDPSLGDGNDDIQRDTDLIKHKKIWPRLFSSTENIFNAKTAENSESLQPTTFKFPEVFYNRAPNSLPCPVPKASAVAEPSYDSSPSAIYNTGMEEHFFYKHKDPWHTHTNSIASDMQVEVSEIGSPPLTADGIASSNDGESLVYDGDSEQEITSGSEDMWGASPLAPKVQEHENVTRQIYEVGEGDITEEGYSRLRNEPEDPTSSSLWSLSSSRAEISQEDQAHSMSIDPKHFNYVKHIVEEEREQRPSNPSDVVPPEHSQEGMQLMEDSMPQKPSEVYFQKPQESRNAPGNSAEEMNINCDADDTVTYDDRGDLKSNENIYVGAENSMMQVVIANLSEPAEGSNSKSNSNIMSESLINPEKSVEGMDGSCNVHDSRLLINDHLEDSKSNEDRDGGAEKAMQVLVSDQSQPDVESNSESRKHIESKSLNSPEKSGEDANLTYNVNDPLVHIKNSVEELESIEDIDRDYERLTEHSDIKSTSMPVEVEDNPTSTQGSREDQTTLIEVGVSGVNQSFNDPTTSGILPELIVEQASTNSSLSSSPKSVLAYRIPADIGSSSDFSQLVSTDMEERLPLTATQDTSHVVNDSVDHPSIDNKSEKSEEPSNTQGKPTEEAIEMENMKGSSLDDEETMEDLKSRKNIDEESETSIGNEAPVKLSKPQKEISPRSFEHLEDASARLADNETNIDVSKSEGEHSTSDVPGLMVEEEESTNRPRDVAGEVNLISEVSYPSINKKEDLEKLRSFEGSEGEPQFSTRQEIFVEPVKPANITSLEDHDYSPRVLTENETIVVSSQAMEDVDNSSNSKETDGFGTRRADQEIGDLLKPAGAIGTSETTKDVQGNPKDLTDQKAVFDPSKPAVDGENILVTLEAKDSAADIIHNVNEAVASEFINNEKFNHVQDSEDDEYQRLDSQENIMEPLKAVAFTNSESIRDLESESKILAEDEVNVIPSYPAGEINSSNDRENTEDPGKSTVHLTVMTISEPSRGYVKQDPGT